MKSSEIKIGETYLFVATEAATRKHLEGQPFEVREKRRVWRRIRGKRANVWRFFNDQGEAARAEELEPIDTPICALPRNIQELAFKEIEPLPACERSEHWPEPAFARVDPKDYEVNNDGQLF